MSVVSRAVYGMRTMSTGYSVDEYLRQILAALNGEPVKKIILFGSATSGELGIDSDLDLLVVVDTDYLPNTYQQRMEYRLQILRKVRAVGNRIPLDLLIYTRPEYEILTQDMSSFMKDVHDCGKVIYERAS